MSGKRYAKLEWTAEDVQDVRPEWSLPRCERWLAANEKHIRDRLCELGFEVMEVLLDYTDCECKAKGKQ